jgi:hypothetical protein
LTNEEQRLYRFGLEPETAQELEAACEGAVPRGFPDGVSVRTESGRPDAAMASRSEVELYFTVHKTGRNPYHYTVELPHPVTDEAAETFNRVFGRLD